MSISQKEFDEACSALQQRWLRLNMSTSWQEVRIAESFGTTYLLITRKLQIHTNQTNSNRESEFIEEDDEALDDIAARSETPLVLYDIIHSPSYQVPVLYFTLKHHILNQSGMENLSSLEEVYKLLVPASNKAQMKRVGVMGALSMVEHPITGLVAYFVHPCRTADAMRAVRGDSSLSPETYLMLWLGLIGQNVGLEVPVELATAMGQRAKEGK